MPSNTEPARLTHLRDALQVAEEHFFATFELAPVGIAHVSPDGRWLRVNRRLCAILGYEVGELLHLRFQDLTHPEDLAADLDQALRTVAGEQSSYTIEKRYIRKDGSSIWAEVRVSLVRELASEKPLYFVAVIDDVTRRRRAEQAAERRTAELQALLDGLPDIVSRFDRQGRHLYVNPAVERATGRAAGEFVGRTNRELGMPPALVEEWERVLDEVVATGEPREVSFAFPTPEGERRYWSLLVPEHEPDGGVAGVLCVSRQVGGADPPGPLPECEWARGKVPDGFRSIFEEAGVGLAEVALDGRLLRVNGRFREIVGRGARELEGRTFQELTAPEDLAADVAQLERVLAGEISGYSMEKRYLRPDGEAVWADLTVAPVRDEAGKPAYFVSVVHDIQARKEAERRLAESEARLRFLSEMIPQMVWSTRPDGFHDYYNSRWFEYTGLSYEDSSGPGWMEVLHPDDRERAGRRWLHSLRTGEPYSIEYRFRRRDGEYRWFLGLAAPLRGVDGGIERWFGTCTDIQEQKDLERSLRDARERLEAALDASATGTFRWDLRTGAVECDAALAGVFEIAPDRVPVSPRGFLELLHPDERERVAAAARRIGAGEGSFEVELRVLLADGGARWVLTKGRTRVDDGGRPLCVSGACVDITDRKTAELEREALLRAAQAARGDAETASELKSRFVATMSHEIRTPINAVLGYADLLEMGVSGPLNDAQGEQVRRILRSGRHLLALVNDALDMAKIEAGEMHVARAPVDARSLCRGVLELTEPLCASRSIMVVDATEELEGAAVWGDEDRIRQILVNLLTNACKFTPPRRAVRIGWSAAHRPPESVTSDWTGRWLGIEVEDAGPGIAPEMHEAVFAPFVQDEAGREAGQGTGLGLAISRTLARMMGGEVTLRSAPGEGSCFTLWLQAETEP